MMPAIMMAMRRVGVKELKSKPVMARMMMETREIE